MSFLKVFFLIIFVGWIDVASGQKWQARALYDEGARLEKTDPLAAATLYYNAGTEGGKLYKLDTAILFLEKAKSLFAKHEGGGQREASACHALGDIYKYDLYNFDEAEKNYERALSILETVDPPDIRNLTRLYYNLATTNRSQRDHETAVTWCLKAIGGSLKMKDNAFLERSYSIMGNIYRDRHLYDSAIVYYKKGIAVNTEINHGKQNETLAGFYNGWGDTNYRQGDLEEAEKKLSTAVRIYQKSGVDDKSIYLYTVRLLAEVYIQKKEPANAYPHLRTAEELTKQLSTEKGGPASTLFRIFGDYHLQMKDTATSRGFYQKALQATTLQPLGADGDPTRIDEVDFKDYAYDALLAKAGVLVASGDVDHAIQCFSITSNLMTASRRELDTEDAKWNYIDANFRLYENALSALYTQNMKREEDVFHFIEASKSKSLGDALREAELKKTLGQNDTLIARLRTLRQNSLSLQHKVNEKEQSAVRDELIKVGKEISAVEAMIDAKYPSYLQTKYEQGVVQLQSVAEKVKLLDAAFVEYFWGYDNIFAMVITGDTTVFVGLGSPADVATQVKTLVGKLNTHTNQYSKLAVGSFAHASSQLYDVLVKPFSKVISGKKRLVIVPDGPLIQVPFETMVTDVGTGTGYDRLSYLLNDFIVSYSFSGYYFANERKVPSRDPSLLAFGFTGRSGEASNTAIAGSETELLALSEKFPDGTFLYGAGVTENNFKIKAGDYDLLHLAVHGSGDTGEDYSATLYFGDADGPEDGRLYWYELYGMNLQASLAVLSSCESGIGKTYRGEGMLSMANAFTFAGCSNVVMGLWKVDDQVSVKLMDTFYSELLHGMAIDEALALAKRTYLASADQISANPKIWGSLVAYGEAQVVRPDELHTGWFVLALTVLVVGIVLLVRKTRKK
ncbi:MAG TPA: CHAT domain-containing tetratricopeptide repeat protein [Cyclobacteriaceae bacterium]|nr:CHAT domain-containing tetratricopeptide repeat protein [Cyclobacteriaceae bacterium]